MTEDIEQQKQLEQKRQQVEEAIQDYVRTQLGDDEATLIVTDWVVGYNVRRIHAAGDQSATATFTSSHSSVGTLLGIALTLFERMKKELI